MVDAVGEHLRSDGAGDDVAGLELVDEAAATDVADQRAVPAQGFGEQRARHRRRVQRGGVELHELDVGHRHAGTQRHGDAVAGDLDGVGGDREELARAPGGEEHVAGGHLDDLARGSQRTHAGAAPVSDDQVEREPPFQQRGHGVAHGHHERPLDLGAGGGTAGVDDAGQAVPTLTRQLEPAVGVAVEHGPHGDELVDARRALLDQHPDRVAVAQPRAGRQRVGQVEVGGVRVGVEHRGHAALGPAGAPLLELALGQHADLEAVHLGGPHRRGQPGHARADDQQVERRDGRPCRGGWVAHGRWVGVRPPPAPRRRGGVRDGRGRRGPSR